MLTKYLASERIHPRQVDSLNEQTERRKRENVWRHTLCKQIGAANPSMMNQRHMLKARSTRRPARNTTIKELTYPYQYVKKREVMKKSAF